MDCDLLYKLYIEDELTQREIADKLNRHCSTISSHMNRCGIKGRTRSECVRVASKKGRKIIGGKKECSYSYNTSKLEKMPFNKRDLSYWYEIEQWAISSIAELYDISNCTIRNYLIKYGISIRTGNRFVREFDIDKKLLYSLYIVQEKTLNDIANMFGCSRKTVGNICKRHNILIRNDKEAMAVSVGQGKRNGDNHPRWKGGNTRTGQGYVLIRNNSNLKSSRGYISEHLLVWEAHNGSLPEGHHIHHLNGIKDDNRIENLCSMPSKEHKYYIPRLHAKIKELEEENLLLKQQLELLDK